MTIVQTLLRTVVDTIFPPSTDMQILRDMSTEDAALLYNPQITHALVTLCKFTNPKVSALIHEAKFHQNKQALDILGGIVRTHLEGSSLDPNIILVPVPLSRARMRARGYNQVTEVLKIAVAGTKTTVREDILKRNRNTRPQTSLDRSARLKNMKGAFTVVDPEKIIGKNIVLVDDVLTTGTTLHEAKATLLPHGARNITCLAIAH